MIFLSERFILGSGLWKWVVPAAMKARKPRTESA